nr:PHB accumulation regulatory domain-containing protein [Chromobacterium sp. Beijing]
MMANYMEQSTSMFLDMQNRMQEQTKQLFGGFAFPAYKQGEDDKDPS